MGFSSTRFGRTGFILVLGLALVLSPTLWPTSASAVVWTGAHDGFWNTNTGGTATNWSTNALPTDGDDLVFDQVQFYANPTSTNDLLTLTYLASISLSSTSVHWAINSSTALELRGGFGAITNSGTNAINADIILNNAIGSFIASNSGTLTISGSTLNASSQALTFEGAGNTTVTNNIINGTTIAKNGTGTLTSNTALTAATLNANDGTTTLNGAATVGTFNNAGPSILNIAANLGTSTSVIGSAGTANFNSGFLGTVPTVNVTAGTTTVSSGAAGVITTLNSSGGATWINNTSVGAVNAQTGGIVNLNGTVATLNVQGGTVNTTGANARVATANFNKGSGTVTASPANALAVTGQLNTSGAMFNWTAGAATAFTVSGTNIRDDSVARTLNLAGGTLGVGGIQNSIGVHWSNYGGGGNSPITGTDGVVPQSNWNNVGTGWYSGNASNLLDSTGTATTAAVNINATGAGTCWSYTGPIAGLSNLLVGPWGGDGPGRRANVITGIPSSYSTYEIIAYVNQPYGANCNVWLDSNPTSSNGTNPHAAGSDRYFSPTLATPGFVPITNTTAGNFPAGNYVVYSGLSGAAQTLWLDGTNANRAIYGFQIVDTAPISLNISQTAVSLTVSSTLNVVSTSTLSMGNLTLTNSGTSLAITSGGPTSVGFNNVTATSVGNTPGAAVTGVSALTVNGSNVDVTNANNILTLPAVTFTGGSVTVNNSGLGKLVVNGGANFTGTTPTLNVAAGTLQFTTGLTGVSQIGVANGATLAGTGTIGGTSGVQQINIAAGGVIAAKSGTLAVTSGSTLGLTTGSVYQWEYSNDTAYGKLDVTLGTLSLPAVSPPVFRPVFTTPPAPSPSHPYNLATWTTPPTNRPTWSSFDGSMLPSTGTAEWSDGATGGSFATPGNWSAISYTGASIIYNDTAKALQLTGLTLGVGAPLTSIPSNANLTMAPLNTSTSLTVTGPTSTMTIGVLAIGDAAKVPATATLNLQGGGTLTVSDTLNLSSNGVLATVLSGAILHAGTIGSAGTMTFGTSATLTAATLNVLGGTATFDGTTTSTLPAVNVSNGGQLTMNYGSIAALTNVSVQDNGTLNLGSSMYSALPMASLNVNTLSGSTASVTIGSASFPGDAFGVLAATLAGGTTTFNGNPGFYFGSTAKNKVAVSGATTIVNFNGPQTTISDPVGGLAVSGGTVTFATDSTGDIALLSVSSGSVSLQNQNVATANLSAGSTTVAGGLGASTFGSTALSLSGAANLTVNGGAVGPTAFNANYSGTATFATAATGPASVTLPAGVTGIVNLHNSNAMTSLTVGGGTVSRTGNVSGATTVSAGSLDMSGNVTGTATVTNGSFTLATGSSIGGVTQSNGTVTLAGAINVTGGVDISGGTFNPPTTGSIASLSLSGAYAGSVTIPAGVTVTNASVGAGTATFNSTAPLSTFNASGGTTNLNTAVGTLGTSSGSTVNVGPGVTAATAALAGGTVKADTVGNPLSVTTQLTTSAGAFHWTPASGGGPAFTVAGTNIVNDTNPRTMTLTGGTLAVSGNPSSIGVHWSYYNNYDKGLSTPQGVSNITGIDGVVPQGNWTNIGTKWNGVDSPNTNLADNKGAPTTAAVDIFATGSGTCWWVNGPNPLLSNLLVGPWGGNGPRVNVITGIPYANYNLIAYVNQPYGANNNVWLDGNPSLPDAANAHAPGSDYYFSPTLANPGFVQITNTTSGTFPAGNYVVYSGLSGAAQTLWLDVVGLSGQAYTDYNRMISGFQVVDTSIPNLDVPQTTIAVTASSTLSVTQGVGIFGDLQVSSGQTLSLNGKVAAKTVSGAGSTSVLDNSSLTADSIVQNTLSIGAGATVTIRETAGGAVNAVPEPGTWALLIAGAACCLPLLRRLRRVK